MATSERERKTRSGAGMKGAAEDILARLLDVEGVKGLVVIDRRGSPLLSLGAPGVSSDLLLPLVATLAGAGHLAVQELEANPDVRVTAKSDRTRIHIAGIDEERLLVTVADSTRPWAGLRPQVNEARRGLREAFATNPP